MNKDYINPIEIIIDNYKGEKTSIIKKFSFFLIFLMCGHIIGFQSDFLYFLSFIGFAILFYSFYQLSMIKFSSFLNYKSVLNLKKYNLNDIKPAFNFSKDTEEIQSYYSFENKTIIVFSLFSLFVGNFLLALIGLGYIITSMEFHDNLRKFIYKSLEVINSEEL